MVLILFQFPPLWLREMKVFFLSLLFFFPHFLPCLWWGWLHCRRFGCLNLFLPYRWPSTSIPATTQLFFFFQFCMALIEVEMVSTQFYCRIRSQDRRTVLLSRSQFHEKAYWTASEAETRLNNSLSGTSCHKRLDTVIEHTELLIWFSICILFWYKIQMFPLQLTLNGEISLCGLLYNL